MLEALVRISISGALLYLFYLLWLALAFLAAQIGVPAVFLTILGFVFVLIFVGYVLALIKEGGTKLL